MKESFEAEGEIASIDLLRALCAVGRGGITGRATFVRGPERVALVFEGGVLVDLEAPGESCVSEVLIRSGKVQRETYEALVIPPGEDRFAVATASGVISRKEALWGRKLSAIESLAHLLAWPEGTYAFVPLAPESSSGFRLPVDKWILELFLRSNDRALVMSRIGPTDLPLVKSGQFVSSFSDLGLTADADSVVSLVDGERSVEGIVRKAHADEFAVLKLLAALMTLGLIRPAYEAPFPLDAAIESPAPDAPLEEMGIESHVEPEAPAFEPASATAFEPAPIAPEPIALPLFALTAPEPREPDPSFAQNPPETPEPRPSRARLWGSAVFVLAAAALWWFLGGYRRTGVPPPAVDKTQENAPVPRTAERPARTVPSVPSVPSVEAQRRSSIVVVPAEPNNPAPAPSVPPANGRNSEKRAESRAGREGVTWKTAAEKGRRTFEKPGEYAYTIQLELACEESTVAKAMGADPARHRVWVAPYDFRGRHCYRVLWGKYKNLAKAKDAKGSIPAAFLQNGNRPSVIALPGARSGGKSR